MRSVRRSGCATLLGCLGVVTAAVYVIVHAVTAWITGHAWIVWVVAGMAAAGGVVGGWLAIAVERRRAQREEDALSWEERVARVDERLAELRQSSADLAEARRGLEEAEADYAAVRQLRVRRWPWPW